MRTFDEKTSGGKKNKSQAPTVRAKAVDAVSTHADALQLRQDSAGEIQLREASAGPLQMRQASAGVIQMRYADKGHVQKKEQNQSNNTSGTGLHPEVRPQMESSFGADFSGVQVHTGPDAIQKTSELGAQAYTQGNNIYFNQGKYDHNSIQGKALLGHELTHVVQQRAGRVQASGQAKGMNINTDQGLEREADVMGMKAARGEKTGMAGVGGVGGDGVAQMSPEMKWKYVPLLSRGGNDVSGDGSWWGLETMLNIHPEFQSPKSFDLSNQSVKRLSTKDLRGSDFASTSGTIELRTDSTTMFDYTTYIPGLWDYNLKVPNNFVSVWDYYVAEDGRILLENSGNVSTVQDQWVETTPESYGSMNYRMKRDLTGTGVDKIDQKIALYDNARSNQVSETETLGGKSTHNYDFGVGFSGSSKTHLDIHFEANGEDIAIFFGGSKAIAGKFSKMSKNEKLLDALGGQLNDFLKKQDISADITIDMAQRLAASYDYKRQDDWEKKHTHSLQSSFISGGSEVASESNVIRIDQNITKANNVFFKNTNDKDITKEISENINEFLSDNKLLVDKIKKGGGYKIALEGHTDRVGSDNYNKGLGDERVRAVQNHLIKNHGFDFDDFVSIKTLGESGAVQSTTLAADRRVRIKIGRPISR
jgi:outer membrane protein OmpA-like peptidoglycan-associated protein